MLARLVYLCNRRFKIDAGGTLLPIILTASQIVLAADSVPKFDVERTCWPAAASIRFASP